MERQQMSEQKMNKTNKTNNKNKKEELSPLYKKLSLGPEIRAEEPKGVYPKGRVKQVFAVMSGEMNSLMRVNAWFLRSRSFSCFIGAVIISRALRRRSSILWATSEWRSRAGRTPCNRRRLPYTTRGRSCFICLSPQSRLRLSVWRARSTV